MMQGVFVYLMKDKRNGRVIYVGRGSKKRARSINRKYKGGDRVGEALREVGRENIEVEIIECVSEISADLMEFELIQKHAATCVNVQWHGSNRPRRR